jgi:flagellar protein FliO/FliZ
VTALALRILLSLLVVLTLMWALARMARGPLLRRGALGGLAVVARQQLSRNASLVVVRLADRGLVLGVTDQQVRLLGETDPAELEVLAQPVRRRPVAIPRPGRRESTVDARMRSTVDESNVDISPLAGSVLSRRTWSQLVEFLRERTARQS